MWIQSVIILWCRARCCSGHELVFGTFWINDIFATGNEVLAACISARTSHVGKCDRTHFCTHMCTALQWTWACLWHSLEKCYLHHRWWGHCHTHFRTHIAHTEVRPNTYVRRNLAPDYDAEFAVAVGISLSLAQSGQMISSPPVMRSWPHAFPHAHCTYGSVIERTSAS